MYSLNWVKVFFVLATIQLVLVSILTNISEKYVPAFVHQLWRHGKVSYKGSNNNLMSKLQISKSYSKHYYVYSLILTTCATFFMILVLMFHFPIPTLWYDFLNIIGGSPRQANVSAASALLGMILLTAHCCRRFYDTHFVSIFGKNVHMNLFVYLSGFVYYTGAVIAILMEAPLFAASDVRIDVLQWSDLTYVDLVATVLVFWADWHQYKANTIMADLRKNKKGVVVTHQYKLPHGDWFEYVSSPHMLAEILVYFALTIVLRHNTTWLCVFLMVLSNQVEIALLSHWWYQATFKDLPKNRKAIIPFVL